MRSLLFIGLMTLTVSCGALKAFKRHVSDVDELQVTRKVPIKKEARASSKSIVVQPSSQGRPQRSPFDSVQNDQLGSLWSEKGQDNFYFSKNTRRRAGDIIILRSGSEVDEMIKGKLEAYFAELERRLKSQKQGKKTNTAVANVTPPNPEEKVELGDVTMRLKQSLQSGSFSVEGQKPLFYNSRKFDVRITGIVKMEDINSDDTLASSRLLESNIAVTP